jgi:hypothetical protein
VCQDLRKFGYDFRDHATEQMKRLLTGPIDRLDDGGMVMADRGAHLTRGKVKVLAAIAIGDDGAVCR